MRDKVCRALVAVCGLAFLLFWFFDPVFSVDETEQRLIRSVISHLLGSAVFVMLLLFLRYRIWHAPGLSCLVVLIPSLLVVVNNLPILSMINGDARVERWDLMVLFILDSLLIGAFEEFAFRGTLFLVILEKHRASSKQIFMTTLISSAVFGLVHFANMLEGQGIVPTLMQVGYSLLIGGMCAIVLLKTGNLLFSILLHAIFDFCGGLMPTIGGGTWWDTPTVVFTAVLAVAVSAWMLIVLFRIKPEETEKFYPVKERRNHK